MIGRLPSSGSGVPREFEEPDGVDDLERGVSRWRADAPARPISAGARQNNERLLASLRDDDFEETLFKQAQDEAASFLAKRLARRSLERPAGPRQGQPEYLEAPPAVGGQLRLGRRRQESVHAAAARKETPQLKTLLEERAEYPAPARFVGATRTIFRPLRARATG